VTYTDNTAVRLSSLDATDLLVTGPNGYSNLVEFIGADLPADGSPMTGTYSISAPGDSWEATDNGTYTVTLLEGAVEDTLNNSIPQMTLGAFQVSISVATAGALEVTPIGDFSSSGTVGGPFSPSSITYTLANRSDTALDWSASKTADWLDLSVASGTLDPGTSTTLTVSLNAQAGSLAIGSYGDDIVLTAGTTRSAAHQLAVTLQVAAPLRFTFYRLAEPGVFQMGIEAIAGMEIVLEASANLMDWTQVSTNQVAADGTVTFSDPVGVEPPTRWYRARAVP
jgi:hypothetical protein